MIHKSIWISLFCLPLLISCGNDPLAVDASGVEVKIAFVDVNETIMHADSAELIKMHHRYKEDLTNIYAYLVGYCMQIGDVVDTAFYNSIVKFRSDEMIEKLDGDITAKFKDKSKLEKEVIEGFKHLKFHLSDCKLPNKIVYMNTLFRSGVFCTEEEIGIGLEQFLGAENEVIQKLDPQFYYEWMKEGYDEMFLERDILTCWIETHCVDAKEGNLAENIVRWGKIIYLTEAAFPDKPEHIILRYSEEDYQWALDNEFAFWEYLVNEKLLFKIDDRTTQNMIGDGPFTPGLPEEGSPDRMGQFLGWRMVHSYMEQFDISVEELIKLPYNDILQEFEIE